MRCLPIPLVCAVLFIAGCGPGRDYTQPTVTLPSHFSEATADGAAQVPLDCAWEAFRDPLLLALLQRSEQAFEVRLALSSLEEARALRRASTGSYLPKIDAHAGAERSRTSENNGQPNGGDITNRFDAGFDLAWELDLFGGVQRSREASWAFLAASEEAVPAVRLSWQAEVAAAYLEYRHLQRRAVAITAQAAAAEALAGVTRDRANAGTLSDREASAAEAQAARFAARVPDATAAPRLVLHRLALLIAGDADALARELGAAPPPPTPDPLPAGLPSDLLRRRPDLRQAERQLAYAVARIGVTAADLYPRFILTGSAGLESVDLDDLVTGASHFWSIGPRLQWSIFNSGATRARVRAVEARADQSLIRYEQAVRTALFETETALLRVQAGRTTESLAMTSVAANRRRLEQISVRWTAGLADYDERLDGELRLADAEEAWSAAALGHALAHVAFTKAIGGGFSGPPAP